MDSEKWLVKTNLDLDLDDRQRTDKKRKLKLKPIKEPWCKTCYPPKCTGMYETKGGQGARMFYTGLTKHPWVLIGSKETQEDVHQPTHWRYYTGTDL